MVLKNPARDHVTIVEVGPRDGLQNEKKSISLEDKVEFILSLVNSGCKKIEVGSFVKGDKIPQMQNSDEVFKKLFKQLKDTSDLHLMALVPNLKGLERAKESGVKEIAIFTSISETFNKKNIDTTIDESLEKLRLVAKEAQNIDMQIRGYVSTAFGCPYEGQVSLDLLKRVTNRLFDFGVYEISFGDTIGVATPNLVAKTIEELSQHFDLPQLAMHFHDTYGMAVANVSEAIRAGVRTFDSSAGGLGGCPYAVGASGNLATEDLIYLCRGMGLETHLNLEEIVSASAKIMGQLGRQSNSKTHQAIWGKICKK